jgi:hypothetical protein
LLLLVCNRDGAAQSWDDELSASIVLTEALLAPAKPVDAKRELDTTEMLAKKSQNSLARLQFALASARADREQGGEPTVESMTSEGKAPGAPVR